MLEIANKCDGLPKVSSFAQFPSFHNAMFGLTRFSNSAYNRGNTVGDRIGSVLVLSHHLILPVCRLCDCFLVEAVRGQTIISTKEKHYARQDDTWLYSG